MKEEVRKSKSGQTNTKDALADSFHDLVLKKPFSKITIKNITDGAGVIRPTFYNYFKDKNDVFDYILDRDLFNALYHLIDVGMTQEAITMIFTYFDKNRKFYKKAFAITGQNSFSEVFSQKTYELYLTALKNYHIDNPEDLKVLTTDNIAYYYAMSTCLMVKLWVGNDENEGKDVNDLVKAFFYLSRHSLSDILKKNDEEE